MDKAAVVGFALVPPEHVGCNLPEAEYDDDFGYGEGFALERRAYEQVFFKEKGDIPVNQSNEQCFFMNSV
ncbi:hypothetical protein CUZ56_01875 [Saezia sanguinis]|uniref:Uncharacterized protein n=1 Tax=Saezia sanguinis TaxID=1965230 RepID=A0A433SCX5_9BURK|nr:hypothetical protein CUZ56_01875 [Saezia sanguinis]